MADTSILRDVYGEGYQAPPVTNWLADPHNETGAPQVDTQSMRAMLDRMYSGVPGQMRSLADRVRDDSRPDNLIAGGLDSLANWYSGQPRIGPDTAWPMGMGVMGAMGLGMLGRPTGSSLGLFGGRLSQTADLQALHRAEEMAVNGTARDDIWRNTGWYQGNDGQWRFEIDDTAARLPAPVIQRLLRGQSVGGTAMRSGLAHPVFYNAYGTPAMQLTYMHSPGPNVGGWYSSMERFNPGGNPIVSPDAPGFLVTMGPEPHINRDIALHELQHWIQRREGFETGTDPSVIRNTPGFLARMQRAKELAAQRNRPLTAADEEAFGRHLSADLYRRAIGEVEARNVQMRSRMTPGERRESPPWLTQDVPDARQLLLQDIYGQSTP